jgi:uncharacterized RDD family membrane protein YckC
MAQRTAASRLAAGTPSGIDSFADDHAPLTSRLLAYVLDSIVLFGVTMLFAAASFFNIFFRSDSGRGNPSDAAYWDSVIILLATVPCWLLLNLILTWRRGQTIGQYVLGLRVQTEEGYDAGLGRLLVYWLALHPLLFHPLTAGFWLLLAYTSFVLSQADALTIAGLAVAFLCLVGPLVSTLFLLSDPRRRAIHDRVAAIRVVRLE